jgi:hypothetical protein
VSEEPPVRRTVVIGDGSPGAVPGSGGPIDPLLAAPPGAPNDAPAPVDRSVDRGADGDTDGDTEARHVTTIVIDAEDDLPAAIYTVSEARSPDDPAPTGPRVDPRMKARRIAVSQARGRRRLWWLVGVAVVVLLGLVALGVFSSSLFDIENVRVVGAANSDPQQIAEITDDLRGKPILTADLDAVERRLEALPWVARAEVRMDFPHTVVVHIAERTPVAAFQSADGRWRVIDIDGRVIDVLAGRPVDYPAIFGPGPDAIAGETVAAYAPVAQFITAIPPLLRPRVQHFEVDEEGSVTMILDLDLGAPVGGPARRLTQVDLCAAADLDVQQLVALTAFVETKIDRTKAPPQQIRACEQDQVTTSGT